MLAERAIYFFVILVLSLAGFIWGLIDTRRIIEAPFLYSTGMILIVCPQLYAMASKTSWVPDQAFFVFCIMVVLCSAALYLGYSLQPKRKHAYRTSLVTNVRTIDPMRLYRFGLVLVLIAQFGIYKLSTMPPVVGLWRGWPVYWVQLAAISIPGLTLMLISYSRRPKLSRLLPIILFSLPQLMQISDGGRRAPTLTLPLMFLLPFLIYNRRLRIPRWTIVAGLALGFVVVYAFPEWRGSFKEHDYVTIVQEHPLSGITRTVLAPESGAHTEIADAMIVTGAVYQTGNYEWGTGLYNQLIQNYVPGGIIGYDLKDSLRIGYGVSQNWVQQVYGIPVAFYTDKSGYTDLFTQFGFLGCIVMYWIGRGFRKAHDAAIFDHDDRAVIFLCFFFSFPAGLAVTPVIGVIAVSIPQIILMLVAFKWCIETRTFYPQSRFFRRAPERSLSL